MSAFILGVPHGFVELRIFWSTIKLYRRWIYCWA